MTSVAEANSIPETILVETRLREYNFLHFMALAFPLKLRGKISDQQTRSRRNTNGRDTFIELRRDEGNLKQASELFPQSDVPVIHALLADVNT